MGRTGQIWQEDVRREKNCVCVRVYVCVCMCMFGGGAGGVQEEVGAGFEILDLRSAAAQGQKGSCPYLEVASSRPIITD